MTYTTATLFTLYTLLLLYIGIETEGADIFLLVLWALMAWICFRRGV